MPNEPADQRPAKTFTCDNWQETHQETTGHAHTGYCKLIGLDPRRYEEHFEELGDCPYVRLMRELYDGVLVSKEDIFKETTIMDISDVANLLKALFKVNIDIAHREYFLKIDVPEESNWWYGCTVGNIKPYLVCDANSETIVCYDSDAIDDIVCLAGKWVSFEPTVQLKFSNLHSDNQLNEEGNLICTTKSRLDIPQIVPVNRELSFGYEDNECVQYNDVFYCYDYWKSWKGTYKLSNSTNEPLEKVYIPVENTQNYYDVKPLGLYENTRLQSPTDANDFVKYCHDAI